MQMHTASPYCDADAAGSVPFSCIQPTAFLCVTPSRDSAPRFEEVLFLEEQGDTPHRADTYQHVDDTADYRRLTAEDERHKVELEYTQQTPVYASDYQKK